jgi:hypothetical protein
MKRLLLIAVLLAVAAGLLFFFPGCLDFLQYSEAKYTHTVGINAGSARICYFELEEPSTFNFELSSSVQVNVSIVRAEDLTFEGGNPVLEGIGRLAGVSLVKTYSGGLSLGKGSYAMIISSDQSCSDTKIMTSIKMDCI